MCDLEAARCSSGRHVGGRSDKPVQNEDGEEMGGGEKVLHSLKSDREDEWIVRVPVGVILLVDPTRTRKLRECEERRRCRKRWCVRAAMTCG